MLPNRELTRQQKIAIAGGITAAVVVLGFILYFLIANPVFTAALSDIFIIVLALATIVLDIFILILLWQVIRLLVYLMDELVPVVQALQETVGTVRGTTTFVSDSVVNPAIEVVSKAAGVRRSLTALVGGPGAARPRTAGRPARPGSVTQQPVTPASPSPTGGSDGSTT